jgi:hypothetical protein
VMVGLCLGHLLSRKRHVADARLARIRASLGSASA